MADTTYFPYLRTGFASAVTTPDTAGAPPFVSVTATATVNGAAAAPVGLRLAGPGEIRGLSGATPARCDPDPGAPGVPPNRFAALELRPADLPWMFTPTGPTGDRLRPWLCLVVTDLEETGEPVVDASRSLPLLTVEHPDLWLPDPAEAWAWAHVSVPGDADAAGLQSMVRDHPERPVARLLCPRRLAPERRYVASLVPVFEGGRRAGLGLPVDDTATLAAGWSITPGAPSVDLPVYFSWTFSTGVGGDFRSLALRLRAKAPPAGAGSRPMDITDPGGGLDPLPAGAVTTSLGLEGALQPDGFSETPWNATERAAFETSVAGLIDDRNVAPSGGGGGGGGGTADPTLGPPLWGRWLAGQATVPGATPSWLRELNLDPRTRAAAGLGARVVQEQREHLIAQAWQQVGAIEQANQRLRQSQLARAQGKSRHLRSLPALSDGSFLQLSRPLQDRVTSRPGTTPHGEVAASSLPARLLDGAFRRLARPRGPLGRAFGRDRRDPGSLVDRAAAGAIATPPPDTLAKGTPSIVTPVELFPPTLLARLPGLHDWMPPADWMNPDPVKGDGPDTAVMGEFRQAMVDYATWLRGTFRKDQRRPELDLADLRGRMMPLLDPDVTVAARTAAVVTAPRWAGGGDPLEPIMAAPSFPQPMALQLPAISQELILPGLRDILPDSVTAAVPNRRFIEAYLVGLNHEMSRELLYREFPTDQRGTYFRQFWDVRGRVPAPAAGTTDDIDRIDGWDPASALGTHLGGRGPG